MSFITKEQLENFKSFCKEKEIKETLLNYIVWKDNYMNKKDKE